MSHLPAESSRSFCNADSIHTYGESFSTASTVQISCAICTERSSCDGCRPRLQRWLFNPVRSIRSPVIHSLPRQLVSANWYCDSLHYKFRENLCSLNFAVVQAFLEKPTGTLLESNQALGVDLIGANFWLFLPADCVAQRLLPPLEICYLTVMLSSLLCYAVLLLYLYLLYFAVLLRIKRVRAREEETLLPYIVDLTLALLWAL